MKSLLSLMAALAVVAGLVAGGYYLSQQLQGTNATGAASHGAIVMNAIGGDASLTLTNGTHYILTIAMKQAGTLVRFELGPGEAATRSLAPGSYAVDGKLSDPNTDPFSAQWSFQAGGQYNATFSRDQQTGQANLVLLTSGAQPQGNTKQGTAKPHPTPRP